MSVSGLEPVGPAVAVVVARDGRLPVGADQAVAEAGGQAVVVGSGAEIGAGDLVGAGQVWWSETGPGLRPAALAAWLGPVLEPVPLVIMPSSPDGRDLAPRLAATLGRPLVARASSARYGPGDQQQDVPHAGARLVRTLAARIDDRVLVPVDIEGPAVVTLAPNGPVAPPPSSSPTIRPLPVVGKADPASGGADMDPQMIALVEPDVTTMDLSDAARVMSGGAGLAAGLDDRRAAEAFAVLGQVGAALDGSAGATRVATDAGWTGYERQIGTTGVTIAPALYIAFGVSGATQHVGGIGNPRQVISVNTDSAAPMTAMADLGLVTDARALLLELARRLGVDVPADLQSDQKVETTHG